MVRFVKILQGVSGSGKSSWARAQPNTRIVSTDDSFYQPDGSYSWEEAKLGEAHSRCFREFIHLVVLGSHEFETLIVDNTNTRALFMAPYVAVALSWKLSVEIISFRAPAEICAARNNGRAPMNIIQEMIENIDGFHMPTQWEKQGVQFRIVETTRGVK